MIMMTMSMRQANKSTTTVREIYFAKWEVEELGRSGCLPDVVKTDIGLIVIYIYI